MEDQELLNLIESAFPELNINEYRTIDRGWDNYVIIVNESYTFKIPRRPEVSITLAKEIDITSCLDDCPAPIPRFIFKGEAFGNLVAGYEYFQGKPLKSLKKMGESLSASLLEFLNYLYSKSNDDCVLGSLGEGSTEAWMDVVRTNRDEFFDAILPYTPDDILSGLAYKFDSFLNGLCDTLDVSLIHGDLHEYNVLVDGRTGALIGIIDWGESFMGDPALDFAGLRVDFSTAEVESLLSRYKGKIDVNFRKRLEFYWCIEPLFGLRYYHGRDENMFESKLEELRTKLNTSLY